jgi:hypothetical protein
MMIRTTVFAALLALPLATAPLQAGETGCDSVKVMAPVTEHVRPVDTLALSPAPETAGDVLGGRGPNPHARELRDIAIYESIGNRDGAEMVAAQLRQFGISHQAIQRSVDRIKVHGIAPSAPRATGARADAGLDVGQ